MKGGIYVEVYNNLFLTGCYNSLKIPFKKLSVLASDSELLQAAHDLSSSGLMGMIHFRPLETNDNPTHKPHGVLRSLMEPNGALWSFMEPQNASI